MFSLFYCIYRGSLENLPGSAILDGFRKVSRWNNQLNCSTVFSTLSKATLVGLLIIQCFF